MDRFIFGFLSQIVVMNVLKDLTLQCCMGLTCKTAFVADFEKLLMGFVLGDRLSFALQPLSSYSSGFLLL